MAFALTRMPKLIMSLRMLMLRLLLLMLIPLLFLFLLSLLSLLFVGDVPGVVGAAVVVHAAGVAHVASAVAHANVVLALVDGVWLLLSSSRWSSSTSASAGQGRTMSKTCKHTEPQGS